MHRSLLELKTITCGSGNSERVSGVTDDIQIRCDKKQLLLELEQKINPAIKDW